MNDENIDNNSPIEASIIEALSFMPSWARNDNSQYHKSSEQQCNARNTKPRRSNTKFAKNNKDSKFPFRSSNRNNARHQRTKHAPFDPIVTIDFYPNDENYESIITTLKTSRKTYELFDVAKKFLEQPEQYAMVIKKKDTCDDTTLYLTTDDDFIFNTEDEAVHHILLNHFDKYFEISERESEQPKGNFSSVNKCGITGKILCPSNYHDYHRLLLEHHERFLPHLSIEEIEKHIEKLTDNESIENWKSSASKITVYTPKESQSEETPKELMSFFDAKQYFNNFLKSKAITHYKSVRISGTTFQKMPKTLLSKSIFVTIEREKKFPLNLSNNLRGRLRRSGFSIYKLGGKNGISYLSPVRRKFRTPDTIFADNIQTIIQNIDNHPKITAEELFKLVSNDANVGQNLVNQLEIDSNNVDAKTKFLQDLHWLIMEGYVTEFHDNSLVATPILAAVNAQQQEQCNEPLESAEPEKLVIPQETESNTNQPTKPR